MINDYNCNGNGYCDRDPHRKPDHHRPNKRPDHHGPDKNHGDYGPKPLVVDIDSVTVQNNNYRTTFWTGRHLQVTLMSIVDEIGLEIHPDTDQFLCIEDGYGYAMMGKTKDNLTYHSRVGKDSVVFVPAGTWHNIVNRGNRPLKIYTIYAPPHHRPGTIHHTRRDSEKDVNDHY